MIQNIMLQFARYLFHSSKLHIFASGAGAAWSCPLLSGAGADPIGLEPESARGPWAFGAGASAGAAQKSGGSATLL